MLRRGGNDVGAVAWSARRIGCLKGRVAFLVALVLVATMVTLQFGGVPRAHDSLWQHAGGYDLDMYAGWQ